MESLNEKKGRQLRRKKNDLNENLFLAAKAEIIEHGFETVTVMNIVKRAKVQANVFYNRYENLYDLFDKLIRHYDYWLEDNIKFNGDNSAEKLCSATNALIDSLYEDPFLQKLLIWEISNDNFLTRRTSSKRKLFWNYSLEQKCGLSNYNSTEIKKKYTLIIGGIYYHFICNKSDSPINKSFYSKDDIVDLKSYVKVLISKLF